MMTPKPTNGTRWSAPNWLKADLARITEVTGGLPVNHLTDKLSPREAFAVWLGKTVRPETFDWVMSNENAFSVSYSAYRNLAGFEASMKTNPTSNREPQTATERTTND
ncbi:hypothetical protein [Aestuariivirga sp.]|uniref:hypothetical protein n=1 Tax=Aestuariivirga sp. TaxID=2650926 RepID=UPI00391AD2AB